MGEGTSGSIITGIFAQSARQGGSAVVSPETVRAYAVDEDDDPLAAVLVRHFDSGDLFVTQNVTAAVGLEACREERRYSGALPESAWAPGLQRSPWLHSRLRQRVRVAPQALGGQHAPVDGPVAVGVQAGHGQCEWAEPRQVGMAHAGTWTLVKRGVCGAHTIHPP